MESIVEHFLHCHSLYISAHSLDEVTSTGISHTTHHGRVLFLSFSHVYVHSPTLPPSPFPRSHPALASSLNHRSTSERVSTTVWQWGLLRYWEQKQAVVHKVVMTVWYCNTPWGGAQTTSSLLASSRSKMLSAKYSSAFNYYIQCESQEVNEHVFLKKLCFDRIHDHSTLFNNRINILLITITNTINSMNLFYHNISKT